MGEKGKGVEKAGAYLENTVKRGVLLKYVAGLLIDLNWNDPSVLNRGRKHQTSRKLVNQKKGGGTSTEWGEKEGIRGFGEINHPP